MNVSWSSTLPSVREEDGNDESFKIYHYNASGPHSTMEDVSKAIRGQQGQPEPDDDVLSSMDEEESDKELLDDDRDIPCVETIEILGNFAVTHPMFQTLVVAAIVASAVTNGLETSEAYQDNSTLNLVNLIINIIFLVEIIFKVLSHMSNPIFTFYDRKEHAPDWWNIFDFIVVVLSFANINGASILRLIRLLRLLKLVRRLQSLQLLITGILYSMTALAFIFILLIIVFFFFSIVGGLAFNDTEDDDPMFGDFHSTAMALFGISLGGSWGDVLVDRSYECDPSVDPSYPACTGMRGRFARHFTFMVVFLVCTRYAMMNLVVGAITQSMDERRKQDKLASEGLGKKPLPESVLRKKTRDDFITSSKFPKRNLIKLHIIKPFDIGEPRFLAQQRQMLREVDDQLELLKNMRQFVASLIHESDATAYHIPPDFSFRSLMGPPRPPKKAFEKTRPPAPPRAGDDTPLFERCPFRDGIKDPASFMNPMQVMSVHWMNTWAFVAHHAALRAFATVAAIAACILAAIDTYSSVKDEDWVTYTNLAVNLMFLVEAVVNLWACGYRPWMFFLKSDLPLRPDFTRWLDVLIIITAFGFPDVGKYCRILRVVRVVRVVPELKMLAKQLLSTFGSMVYVIFFLLFFLYIFAIGAVHLFRDSDPVHFDTLPQALFSLFQIGTMDYVQNIVYPLILGCDCDMCDWYVRSGRCVAPESKHASGFIFYVAFSLISSMGVFKLVLGFIVVITKASAANDAANQSCISWLKSLEWDGPIILDGGKLEVPISFSRMQKLVKRLIPLQNYHEYQKFRLLTAHVAGLFYSKSLLRPKNPEKEKLTPIKENVALQGVMGQVLLQNRGSDLQKNGVTNMLIAATPPPPEFLEHQRRMSQDGGTIEEFGQSIGQGFKGVLNQLPFTFRASKSDLSKIPGVDLARLSSMDFNQVSHVGLNRINTFASSAGQELSRIPSHMDRDEIRDQLNSSLHRVSSAVIISNESIASSLSKVSSAVGGDKLSSSLNRVKTAGQGRLEQAQASATLVFEQASTGASSLMSDGAEETFQIRRLLDRAQKLTPRLFRTESHVDVSAVEETLATNRSFSEQSASASIETSPRLPWISRLITPRGDESLDTSGVSKDYAVA